MKYIIFKGFAGNPVPIIFPPRIMHDEMREQLPYSQVLSAGYVSLGPDGFACHGASKALGLSAAEGDAEIMARFFAPDAED